jgi:twitching motility protein PilU
VIGQRLLHGIKIKRVPAMEIMLSSAYVADLIEKGEITTIREAMKESNEAGMQTFDQALYKLYAAGEISYAEALQNADSHTDLALRVRLEGPEPPEGAQETQDMEILSEAQTLAPWAKEFPNRKKS